MRKLCLLTLVLLPQLLIQASATNLFLGPLINAEWLIDNIDDVVILDSRKEIDTFSKEGHIENALLVDVNKIRIEREINGKKLTRMRPDAKSFQQFMRQHGINNDSNVVLTQRGKTPGQVAGAGTTLPPTQVLLDRGRRPVGGCGRSRGDGPAALSGQGLLDTRPV